MTVADVVPYSLRKDLEWTCRDSGTSAEHWIVHDPLSDEYFMLNTFEREIAISLDGKITATELIRRFIPWFPREESMLFLQSLVSRLHSHRLLHALDWERSPDFLPSTFSNGSANPWFQFRMPLFDPSALLAGLRGVSRALFSLPSAIVLVIGWVYLLFCFAYRSRELTDGLYRLAEFNVWQVSSLALVLIAIKVLHELGHSMACERFGAKCREVGLLFFLGIPTMYCDASGSWLVANRWARIAIASAGIYVECWVALLAGCLWLETEILFAKTWLLQIVVACTIGTLFFNANPLLKYDGYFVLCDWLGIVNLMQQSRDAFLKCLSTLSCFRWRADVACSFRDFWLALYFVGSSAYRWFLIFSLFLGMYVWLDDRKFRDLAPILPGILFLAFVWGTARPLITRELNYQRCRSSSRWFWIPRLFWITLAIVVLIWTLGTWRHATTFYARGILESEGLSPVFMPRDAWLEEIAVDGEKLTNEELIARGRSIEELLKQVAEEYEVQRLQLKRDHFLQVLTRFPEVSQSAQETQSLLESAQERLNRTKTEIERLHIRSTTTGVFHQILTTQWDWKRVTLKSEAETIRIRRSSLNQPWVSRGQLIGYFQSTREDDGPRSEVHLYVDSGIAEQLRVGDPVQLCADQIRNHVFRGTIERLSEEPSTLLPEALEGDSLYKSWATDDRSTQNPSMYKVLIRFPSENRHLFRGGLVTVALSLKPSTWASQLWNFVMRR
jgi:putative peptide zinc metalloprotease protein